MRLSQKSPPTLNFPMAEGTVTEITQSVLQCNQFCFCTFYIIHFSIPNVDQLKLTEHHEYTLHSPRICCVKSKPVICLLQEMLPIAIGHCSVVGWKQSYSISSICIANNPFCSVFLTRVMSLAEILYNYIKMIDKNIFLSLQ